MSETRSLLMIVDYKQDFYSSRRLPHVSMDLDRLRHEFSAANVRVDQVGFADLDFRTANYCGRPVVYQSSEDYNLHYKSYVEDMIYGLQLAGALLVPRFECLRAHHNKVFLEVLRDLLPIPALKTVHGRTFGTLEELVQRLDSLEYPCVVKPSAGATSTGVSLAQNREQVVRAARRVSRTFSLVDGSKEIVKSLIRSYHKRRSHHRRKFVVQSFIRGMEGDYKVLIYGGKYYVLSRRNRPNDFRASGSGRFEFRRELPEGLLDACENIFLASDVPFLSIDVGVVEGRFYPVEWQYLSFGNYTLEQSPFWFERSDSGWRCVEGSSVLEHEFARAVVGYLERVLGSAWKN